MELISMYLFRIKNDNIRSNCEFRFNMERIPIFKWNMVHGFDTLLSIGVIIITSSQEIGRRFGIYNSKWFRVK